MDVCGMRRWEYVMADDWQGSPGIEHRCALTHGHGGPHTCDCCETWDEA